MKKFLIYLLVILMLTTQIPTVFAAGSASVKGPGTVRAGDTIEISFTVGGGIYGGQGKISYDEGKLKFKKFSSSLSGDWETEFNQNTGKFVFYDNKMSTPISGSKTIFKASFTVSKDLQPGDKISVTVGSIKLSDENKKESSLGDKTYSATIAPPLSGNCKLASLTVSNATISPAFSTGTTSYSASVPFTTGTLKVSAKAEDKDAKVTIKNTKLTAGKTTTVTITVKAANGTTKTYSIKVKRAQDPNYVPSSNADLKALSVKGFHISPAFSKEVKQYYVWLPYETETVALSAETANKNAELTIGEVTALEIGKGTDIPVTVTAEDGTEAIYTVTAIRAPAPEDTPDFLNPTIPEPEPAPTADPTEPTEPTAVLTPAVTQPDMTQIIILVCGGIACLALGALMGIGIKHLSDKKKSEE